MAEQLSASGGEAVAQVRSLKEPLNNFITVVEPMSLDVFISHSSSDAEIAWRLINLVRSSMKLAARLIRCTSVDGYRLPAGISIDERLRQEIHCSKAFIAIISPNSVHSAYVMFELGVRWGAEKPMIPLLAYGAGSNHLEGPLSTIHALNCGEPGQLHQFVEDLAGILWKTVEPVAAYQRWINEVVEESRKPRDSERTSLRP